MDLAGLQPTIAKKMVAGLNPNHAAFMRSHSLMVSCGLAPTDEFP